MGPFLKVFDILPGWAWALICAGLLLSCGAVSVTAYVKVAAAQGDAATARETLATERGNHQKALANETAKVLKLTRELIAARAAQEKADADAKNTVDGLREDLRRRSRAGGGVGLRDPNATACGGGTPSAAGPAAPGGGAHAAEASGVLSAELEGLLLRLAGEADDINIAYASCRADAVTLREKLTP